jgi:hypothetical protein
MTMEGTEWDILWEIRRGVWDGRRNDAVVLAMKELDRTKGKTLQSLEWSE